MANIDYGNSLKTAGQFPLDGKLQFKTLNDLTDLGTGSSKAFRYYEDMIVQCIEDHKQYIWREVIGSETGGLLLTSFTYPQGAISNGIDYSERNFNFFEYKPSINQNNKIKVIPLLLGGLPITITDVVNSVNTNLTPLIVSEDEVPVIQVLYQSLQGEMMVLKTHSNYWLKSGKGTYGSGNTQIGINDLYNDNDYIAEVLEEYAINGIVFKNLSSLSDQYINGSIELKSTGGSGNAIKVTTDTGNNTDSPIYASNSSTTNITSKVAAIEAETKGVNIAMVLRGDKNIATGNVLEVIDSPKGTAGDTNLSINKDGTITAKTIVKEGSTSDDILLGDGGTLSAASLSGGTEGTVSRSLIDTGGGATYSTGFNQFRYVRVGDSVIGHLTISGINTTGTPSGFLRLEGFPLDISSFGAATITKFHGQPQQFYTIGASVNPAPSNNVLFQIITGLTDSIGNPNLQNVVFTNGAIEMSIIYKTL